VIDSGARAAVVIVNDNCDLMAANCAFLGGWASSEDSAIDLSAHSGQIEHFCGSNGSAVQK
jgi:hypothetical protein